MSTLADRVSEELLPFVVQPAQYIGREWNQAVRDGDWQSAQLRIALAFPDAYTIGMSHLGSQIIYAICNQTPGVCAERTYAPLPDAEQRMRDQRIPLFTWDTRQPVADADVVAFSLQYEMNFTNMLAMLALAGIPRYQRERDESHPLVMAGGPQIDNPEPVADFLDLVVMGDGEPAMQAILPVLLELKQQGASRNDILTELAQRFEWVYVPSFYEFSYHADGTIRQVAPSSKCPVGFVPPARIKRCITTDLDATPFPEAPLVPYVQTVHDRISLEIMRGCPGRCRFCHAGYTKRPISLRKVETIVMQAEQAWQRTGHSEIGLLSLSSADYPNLGELAYRLNERFTDRHVNLSLPSLRVDAMLSEIPWMVNSVRKGGLTLAAEAACEDMRQSIRKRITNQDLLDGVGQAYAAGWNAVKMYFMCGFPGEQQRDLDGIFELAYEVSQLKKRIRGGPAAVTASVSWLVPKPHTPLQWSAMQTADYFHDARRHLAGIAARRRSAVRIKTHRVDRSILEGVFARGDRRLAPVIESAYQKGARMDGWDEWFCHDHWLDAFGETGIDPAFYAHRERSTSEILPWAHITSGARQETLLASYKDMCSSLSQRTDDDTVSL